MSENEIELDGGDVLGLERNEIDLVDKKPLLGSEAPSLLSSSPEHLRPDVLKDFLSRLEQFRQKTYESLARLEGKIPSWLPLIHDLIPAIKYDMVASGALVSGIDLENGNQKLDLVGRVTKFAEAEAKVFLAKSKLILQTLMFLETFGVGAAGEAVAVGGTEALAASGAEAAAGSGAGTLLTAENLHRMMKLLTGEGGASRILEGAPGVMEKLAHIMANTENASLANAAPHVKDFAAMITDLLAHPLTKEAMVQTVENSEVWQQFKEWLTETSRSSDKVANTLFEAKQMFERLEQGVLSTAPAAA